MTLFVRTAVRLYRDLPIGGETKRWLKAVILGTANRNAEPFWHEWRGLKVRLDPRQSLDMRLYYTGDYEPDTMSAIQKIVQPGATILDIGANVGLVALWLAKCAGPGGRVFAAEPSRWAVERLRKNLDANDMRNVHVINAAISDAPGNVEMRIINGYRVDDVDTSTYERVELMTIDDIAARFNIDRVDVIKTDTDGFEQAVLRGAKTVLERDRPWIIFELAPDHLKRAGGSVEGLTGQLRDLDYTFVDESFAAMDPVAFADSIRANDSANVIARPRS